MDNKPGKNGTSKKNSSDQFESDTQKIVRRHLQDKNHVITEEEIRSVRVGMTPPLDETDNAALRSTAENEMPKNGNGDPAGTPLTPWDTVEP